MRRRLSGFVNAVVLGVAAAVALWGSSAWACCLFKKSSRTEANTQTYAMGKHPKQKAQTFYQCPKCKMAFEKAGECPMCKLKLEKVTSKSPKGS